MGGVEVPVVLIGDSAFRMSRYMMKPFPYTPNQPNIERLYNYKLSKSRRVVENAFGQLKARFRKIGKGLEVAPQNVNLVIKTCCILHNFLKDESEEIPSAWVADLSGDGPVQPNFTIRAGENDNSATDIRIAIALRFRKYNILFVNSFITHMNSSEQLFCSFKRFMISVFFCYLQSRLLIACSANCLVQHIHT